MGGSSTLGSETSNGPKASVQIALPNTSVIMLDASVEQKHLLQGVR